VPKIIDKLSQQEKSIPPRTISRDGGFATIAFAKPFWPIVQRQVRSSVAA